MVISEIIKRKIADRRSMLMAIEKFSKKLGKEYENPPPRSKTFIEENRPKIEPNIAKILLNIFAR